MKPLAIGEESLRSLQRGCAFPPPLPPPPLPPLPPPVLGALNDADRDVCNGRDVSSVEEDDDGDVEDDEGSASFGTKELPSQAALALGVGGSGVGL